MSFSEFKQLRSLTRLAPLAVGNPESNLKKLVSARLARPPSGSLCCPYSQIPVVTLSGIGNNLAWLGKLTFECLDLWISVYVATTALLQERSGTLPRYGVPGKPDLAMICGPSFNAATYGTMID